MVRVRVLSHGASQPRTAAVTNGVLAWLDSLEPAKTIANGPAHLRPFRSRAGDWDFELTAIPVSPQSRQNRRRRLVGVFPATGGWDNTTLALRSALKDKARKFDRPDEPLIIAPLFTSGMVSTEDVVAALYGTEVFTLAARDQPRVERRANGFWRAGDGFRGTRVSGVLLGDAILPWTVAGPLPRLWLHPAARYPLRVHLDIPTVTVKPDGYAHSSREGQTGAQLFDLSPSWPGLEPFG